MDKRHSDYRPILVKLISNSKPYMTYFRFDERFLHKRCQRWIKKAWLTNHPLSEAKVYDRLKRCRKALSNWKRKENLNSRDKIKQVQCVLELEQSLIFPSGVRFNNLKFEMVKAYKNETFS